jgi:hypothetical protein
VERYVEDEDEDAEEREEASQSRRIEHFSEQM